MDLHQCAVPLIPEVFLGMLSSGFGGGLSSSGFVPFWSNFLICGTYPFVWYTADERTNRQRQDTNDNGDGPLNTIERLYNECLTTNKDNEHLSANHDHEDTIEKPV